MRVDACTILDQGRRDMQEDALLCAESLGAQMGFTVLADGMGGHGGGEMASKIAITEAMRVLLESTCEPYDLDRRMPAILGRAVEVANAGIRTHVGTMPEYAGMGSTIVAVARVGDLLWWASVGDSPLYLHRDGRLTRLNADHSLGPGIDRLAAAGQISMEEAAVHPDRSVLTSALTGGRISQLDCPPEPIGLRPGDTLLVASDGIATLTPAAIGTLLNRHPRSASFDLGSALLDAILGCDCPNQDNIAVSVNRMRH